MSAGSPRLEELIGEAQRVLAICNACRYCEGYCATFPALERRLEFTESDVHYLANLCHNCGACLYACQYAPPHEFAVSLPQALAMVTATPARTVGLNDRGCIAEGLRADLVRVERHEGVPIVRAVWREGRRVA